VARGGVA